MTIEGNIIFKGGIIYLSWMTVFVCAQSKIIIILWTATYIVYDLRQTFSL